MVNNNINNFYDRIFNCSAGEDFARLAMEIFLYQSRHTPVYRDYLSAISVNPGQVKSAGEIPFLPVEFFKTHKVVAGDKPATTRFTSSGTTGGRAAVHHVPDIAVYEECFTRGFEYFYGNLSQYCILALLPAYAGRQDSSLLYMVQKLMEKGGHPGSGFYLRDYDRLRKRLTEGESEGQKTLLLGVSFALLDFAESAEPVHLRNTIVMETGGMKGRREEIIRDDLHKSLRSFFGVEKIHSEYGMTELLSQAYSQGDGIFRTPPWMRVSAREINDPFSGVTEGRAGGINIIDLANFNTCSFIATRDLGVVHSNGSFEVLGRYDYSEARGCNLMV